MKTFLGKLLDFYNIDFNQYKNDYLDDNLVLPSYTNFKNINDACLFLKEKIKNNSKILIYGDYDCDGIMATSIGYLLLEKYGCKAGFYIPFRETDGYGLTIKNIDKFYSLGYDTIILVDNGITLNKEVDYLKRLGLNCIIIDHHMIQTELPKADYIIHPMINDFFDVNMSAGAVAFYFSYAFLGYIDPYLATLGSISILSDLMPLKKYNKTLVKIGLKFINEYKYSNIVSLLNKYNDINEFDLTMNLIPKINAVGRIINDNNLFNIVRTFITNDKNKIFAYANWIEDVNTKRKELVKTLFENLKIDNSNSMIIEILNTKEGLIGLIANKIMIEYNKPVLIIVEENKDNDLLKGSLRAKNGFNVIEAFNAIQDLVISFGGHNNAGGVEFKKENLPKIKCRLFEFAKMHTFVDEKERVIEIMPQDVNYENYLTLRNFAPFGQDNPLPLFKIKNFYTNSFVLSKDKKHILTSLSINSNLVYFNYDKSILNYNSIDLIGTINDNFFKNHHIAQFKVINYITK